MCGMPCWVRRIVALYAGASGGVATPGAATAGSATNPTPRVRSNPSIREPPLRVLMSSSELFERRSFPHEAAPIRCPAHQGPTLGTQPCLDHTTVCRSSPPWGQAEGGVAARRKATPHARQLRCCGTGPAFAHGRAARRIRMPPITGSPATARSTGLPASAV